ncbi:hypothetical protein PIIN_07185 [Serendipita indica DSM 11827]|uniref:Nephrocystin 3-like N-terminal domain-containing protein n=1 Tax=Serendipita indica (strain DSM 11827) TaxID=1109443 RepID=G4TPJ1_SERID|nr:hypothetical protein PIIN_07185 [Serendipita indica DSM 11827]
MKGLFRRKGSQGASHLHDSSPSTRSSLLEPSTVGGEPSTDVDGESPSLITSNIDTEILPNSVDTYHAITEWLEHGSTPVPDISEATPDLVPLKSASSSLICAIEILMDVHNDDVAWNEMCNDIHSHAKQIQSNFERLDKKGVTNPGDIRLIRAMDEYLGVLNTIGKAAQIGMREARDRSGVSASRFGTTKIDNEHIKHLIQAERESYQIYQVAVDQLLLNRVTQVDVLVEELREDVQATNALGTNDGIPDFTLRLSYGTDLEICEPGACVEILTRIRDWAGDTNRSQQIFWLNDAAGTGKSTVATTIAREWQDQGRLGGRFFFNPKVALDQDIRHFCRMVAYDIVSNHPQLATSINSILIASLEDTMDFAMQFIRLILDPLRSLSATTGIFLVIDALDNCEFKSIQRLLNVIIKELPNAPRIRLLLTSRPMPGISDRLSDPGYIK